MHGGDPEHILKFERDLERLRKEMTKGPFLEEKIKTGFIKNFHRVLFTLAPDRNMAEEQERRLADELEKRRRSMSGETLAAINQDAGALKKLQETQEDISCLPTLGLDDIFPSVKGVKPSGASDAAIRYHQSTAGIFYFSAVAGIASLEPVQVPLLPFLCHAVSKVGTKEYDYLEMARRMDAYTGGIGLGAHSGVGFDGSGTCIPFVSFNGKCLVRNQEKMFGIIEAFLLQFDFSDRVRLKNLLLEYRAALESMVVQNGHRLAMSLAARNFSVSGALNESWHGVHQLRFIKGITDDLTDDKLKSVSNDLAAIGRTVFVPKNLKIALIGEEQPVAEGARLIGRSKGLSDMACSIASSDGFKAPDVPFDTTAAVPREGWMTSSSVSFVASAFETVRMAHEDAPALAAAAKLLRSMYLHREVREKGGAYGGFAAYNAESGIFCFASYRDPHIISTLNVFDGASDFIKAGTYDDEDIKEAVLQVCSEIDKPDTPGPAARKAFYRKILSLTDDARAHFKSELLKLNRDRMAAVAEKYFGSEQIKAVAVISGEPRLNTANKNLGAESLELHQI